MMEVSCAPFSPGSASFPLSPSAATTTITTTTTTTANGSQNITDFTEVSPDSGNGDDLDEFDPLKSPVKVSGTENAASGRDALKDLVGGLSENTASCPFSWGGGNLGCASSPFITNHNAPSQREAREKDFSSNKIERKKSEMIDYVTEKPDLFRLNFQPEDSISERHEWQITQQPDLACGGGCPRSTGSDQHSSVFNLRPLQSSLLTSCSPPFQCGPFSSSCGTVGKLSTGSEENGLFSLPEGRDDMLDTSPFSKSYLLGDNGRTCIKPFSLSSKEETENFHHETSNCCDTSYSLGASQPVKTLRNPEYPRCLRGRPSRRYTNPEVVRKQPVSGGLLTTSCDLMTSPPGQCACVNPGTSHACAPRISSRSSLGVLNPMFEPECCSTQVTHTAVPSSSRKYSLDHGPMGQRMGDSDLCKAPPLNVGFSSSYQEPRKNVQRLSDSFQEPPRRASDTTATTGRHAHSPSGNASSGQGSAKKTSLPTNLESLGCVFHQENPKPTTSHETFAPESILRSLENMSAGSHGIVSAKKYARPPLVTSPDWVSFLTPAQDSYSQQLFTPENLHDELFYPPPYGLKSEIYQNINAREADFVLQKPNRKPRTEPLLPPCLPTSATQRPESPDHQDGIIPPLATEDEEALKEGARESRKASLKERRKSSLEKIYIPKPADLIDAVLNIRIDNFDREEYVRYKKTLSETDILISERLKFATKGKQNSQESDSSINSDNHTKTNNPESLNLDIFEGKKERDTQSQNTSTRIDDTNEYKEDIEIKNEDKSQISPSDFPRDSISKGKLTSGKSKSQLPLPRQRSLEEDQTSRKTHSAKATRKQSLPTEELFGIKRNLHPRKISLNSLTNYQSHLCASTGGTFSPVRETDENISQVSKKNVNETHPYKNCGRRCSQSESPDKGSETRLRGRKTSRKEDEFLSSTNMKSPSVGASLSPYKGAVPFGKNGSNPIPKEKSSSSPYHHQHARDAAHRHHRNRKHLRHHIGRSASLATDDRGKHQKPASQKSQRRAPREVNKQAESHTNLGALLSPPEQEAVGDLFTNRGSNLQDRLTTEACPAVPYEPLVDALTPTTPDGPPAASGATRKERHRRRHRRARARDVSDDDVESDEVSSPSVSSSKSSSSSSTLTSFSGDSNKGSSSSSSSSSSSCSDSSSSCSSSSSSESSSSSSSDSSDIEDLVP